MLTRAPGLLLLTWQEEKMEKSVEAVRRNFGTVRTGRANTSILDRIQARVVGGKLARMSEHYSAESLFLTFRLSIMAR